MLTSLRVWRNYIGMPALRAPEVPVPSDAARTSVVDAGVAPSQRAMVERNAAVPPNERIEFRIGINVGDIIKDSGDIFGDLVNVAVRLEAIAASRRAKNPPWCCLTSLLSRCCRFQNFSADSEQDYFADGMVEDIVTALSQFKALFVIARNSSFTYKGRAVDVKQVGRELGVRYVLEGSVLKVVNRVRITGQLVDAATEAHLWADRFDGGLGDIFDLQDQVTASGVGAIAPAVEKAEIERAKRKPTESLDAYALYLRGLARYYQFDNRQTNDQALRLFYGAIEIDPDFATAYSRAALCYPGAKAHGWISGTGSEIVEVTRLAQRAVELGKDDAVLAFSGGALALLASSREVLP